MKKKIMVFLFCLILLLGGCSSSNYLSGNSGNNEGAVAEKNETKSEEPYGSADYSDDSYDEEGSGQDVDSSTESSEQQKPEQTDESDDQKLVYTCEMTIETLEYDETIKSIKESVKKYSGITERENQTDSNAYWYSNESKSSGTLRTYLVIRIPAANYESFLEELSGNGKVISKNMEVENITKHYSEVKTTIKSLQIQEKRLLDMMEKATTVEDMITVERRLTEVQNELAQYKNALSSLDTDVKYSTINLTVEEVVKYEESRETFSQRLHSTLEESREMFLSFLENFLFAVILFGPILLVIFIIIFIIVKIIGRLGKNKKQKKSRKKVMNRKEKESSGFVNKEEEILEDSSRKAPDTKDNSPATTPVPEEKTEDNPSSPAAEE